jgi:hypothetical protein
MTTLKRIFPSTSLCPLSLKKLQSALINADHLGGFRSFLEVILHLQPTENAVRPSIVFEKT